MATIHQAPGKTMERKTRKIATVTETALKRTELHKETEGNMNYLLLRFHKVNDEWRCYDYPEHLFTVFTKTPDCKRGDFAEEIDLLTYRRSRTEAFRVAQIVIDHEYEDSLYPSKARYRERGFLFF
jgi:hypothetical protein